jgi:probable HAF family extracellular repeat protein
MRKSWRLAVVGWLLLSGKSLGEIRYSITDLGTLGGANSYAAGINNRGQVVGTSDTGVFYPNSDNPVQRAFIFDGALHDLSAEGSHFSQGHAINGAGHIAGEMDLVPFMYDGSFRFIPYNARYSQALAINDSDTIVGFANFPDPTSIYYQAFRYDGTLQFLGTLGGNNSRAYGINASGVIVGEAQTAEVDTSGYQITRAFFYDGTMHEIPGAGPISSASAINDLGQIVGTAKSHAFLYDGKMHDLNPGPGTNSPLMINNRGVVLGNYYPDTYPFFPPKVFIYDGSFRILNDLIDKSLGYTLEEVNGINDAGQIAATAFTHWNNPAGDSWIRHAVLLNPIVPAPRHIFDIATGPASGAINSIRVYGGDKTEFWFSIMNANRDGAADPHNGIYDSGQIYHPGSGVCLGQFTDASGQAYLLIRLTRMGDVNLDGQVSIADFLALASHFNSTGTWQEGDLNYDGLITIDDFIALASNFGTSYSGEAMAIGEEDVSMLNSFGAAHGVPEPGMMIVLLVGIVAGRRGRRPR